MKIKCLHFVLYLCLEFVASGFIHSFIQRKWLNVFSFMWKYKCVHEPLDTEFSYRIESEICQASSNLTYPNFKLAQLEINSKNKNFKLLGKVLNVNVKGMVFYLILQHSNETNENCHFAIIHLWFYLYHKINLQNRNSLKQITNN